MHNIHALFGREEGAGAESLTETVSPWLQLFHVLIHAVLLYYSRRWAVGGGGIKVFTHMCKWVTVGVADVVQPEMLLTQWEKRRLCHLAPSCVPPC